MADLAAIVVDWIRVVDLDRESRWLSYVSIVCIALNVQGVE